MAYAHTLRRGLSRSKPLRSISQALPSAVRQYHSYEHESAPPFTSTENAILSAGLSHVPTEGFTIDALANGARDVGYRDISVNLFPSGAFALVQHHLVTQRLALGHDRSPKTKEGHGLAENIKELALKRLKGNKAIIHRWQEVGFYCFANWACD